MSSSTASASTKTKSDTEFEEMMDRMFTRLTLCDDSNLHTLLSNLLPPLRNKDCPSSDHDLLLEILTMNYQAGRRIRQVHRKVLAQKQLKSEGVGELDTDVMSEQQLNNYQAWFQAQFQAWIQNCPSSDLDLLMDILWMIYRNGLRIRQIQREVRALKRLESENEGESNVDAMIEQELKCYQAWFPGYHNDDDNKSFAPPA